MIEIRISEANARWLLGQVNSECGRLAPSTGHDDPQLRLEARRQWDAMDNLRDELLTVLGDLDDKAQAGTMTPTERSERHAAVLPVSTTAAEYDRAMSQAAARAGLEPDVAVWPGW